MELDEPQAAAGQVRVRVKVAGVQPFDCGVRNGEFPQSRVGDFPIVPGNEFAGVVDQVGEGVSGFSVGDAVLGFNTLGCYAEYIAVGADQVVPKPDAMPWEVAGGFSGAAQGARNALLEMKVAPGETILINGAAGGLGTMALQLAKLWGVTTVIGTAREVNHDHLRSLGAIPLTYGDGLVERVRAVAPDGVDASLASGVEGLRASLELTKDKNRVVTMVWNDEIEALGVHDWVGVRTAAGLAEMVGFHLRGECEVHLRGVYPLDQAAEAQRDVGKGHGRGKVVITID
ncbi:NADP-dependent oxidoreductase [Saccharothrix carnea]|nr:NADP-dependent oxidoreductase [Saccharothrix carnea]